MKEWFNFCAKDGKNIYDILKAIYHCDFAKSQRNSKLMERLKRMYFREIMFIDKRFKKNLFYDIIKKFL